MNKYYAGNYGATDDIKMMPFAFIHYPNALRPENNPGYGTQYRP